MSRLDSISNFIRATVSLVVVGMVSGGAWFAYSKYTEHEQAIRERDELREQAKRDAEELQRRQQKIEQQQQEITRLETSLRLLKFDQRVAQLEIVDQWKNENGEPITRVRFAELDNQGKPLQTPREFNVRGEKVYVEYWVAKFFDEHVENGVDMKNTSICLFRSIFGDKEKPAEGHLLDDADTLTMAYARGREVSPLEHDIWENFWEYANDRRKAAEVGLRAVHGEAVNVKVQKGKTYRIQLRASDGLSIIPEDDAPAAARPTTAS